MKRSSPAAKPIRLQKYISRSGLASRRQAEGWMRAGRIAVNGEPVREMGARVVPGTDTVSVDGRVVVPARRRWIVFHKPPGVLCTRADPHGGETVYDLLPDWASGLRYVGRLDRETSGLLLLTNDGDLAAALAHPSGRVEREYLARVAGRITARGLRTLKRGVELEDGFARPRRVRRVRIGHDEWGVTLVLTEGRKREVRRLLKSVGHPVLALERTRFGPFSLGRLRPGDWRPASVPELEKARYMSRTAGRLGTLGRTRTAGTGHKRGAPHA